MNAYIKVDGRISGNQLTEVLHMSGVYYLKTGGNRQRQNGNTGEQIASN